MNTTPPSQITYPEDRHPESLPTGVYFLANDRILDITVAFLNSFRKHNPDIPLCLIPFRSDTAELEKLQKTYSFTIYNNPEVLALADEISLLFHPSVTGHYRKLACWHGPFDKFIYIDVDMAVLKPLDFAFRLADQFGFVTSLSDIPEAEKWVWRPEIYHTGTLTPDQIRFSANTGFIISERGRIPLHNLPERAKEAVPLAMHMELSCKEQPLLNYLMVTSDLTCSSLWNLAGNSLFPENYVEYWAGNGKKGLQKGYTTECKGEMREVFLIHWAGVWQLRKSEIKAFALFSTLRLKKHIWAVSIFMPLRKLWRKYRYLHQNP
ncbi:MAG TPA: hypothetical protein P5228_11080 [Bacteroidales bacterium]|nr:hypothetical protein [Bacteroidales bacterium]HRZ49351.1 hypothetical protein [Bacteroidales bacterium]